MHPSVAKTRSSSTYRNVHKAVFFAVACQWSNCITTEVFRVLFLFFWSWPLLPHFLSVSWLFSFFLKKKKLQYLHSPASSETCLDHIFLAKKTMYYLFHNFTNKMTFSCLKIAASTEIWWIRIAVQNKRMGICGLQI